MRRLPHSLILLTTLCVTACTTSDSRSDTGTQPEARGEQEATLEEFRFVPRETDEDCSDCPPRVVDMCNFGEDADVMLFGRVIASDYQYEACEDRTYAMGHFAQTLEVLGVAAGADPESTIEIVALSPTVGTEVDDVVLVGLRQIDGVWFRSGAAEVELVDGEVDPQERHYDDTSTVYDFPTTFQSFRNEAQTVWDNYETECGHPREKKSDQEIRDFIYDKDCPADPLPDVSTEGDDDGTGNSDL